MLGHFIHHIPFGSDTLSNCHLSTLSKFGVCMPLTPILDLLERWMEHKGVGTHGGISHVSVSLHLNLAVRTCKGDSQHTRELIPITWTLNHLSLSPLLSFSLTFCRICLELDLGRNCTLLAARYCRHASMTSPPCVTPAKLVREFWGYFRLAFFPQSVAHAALAVIP